MLHCDFPKPPTTFGGTRYPLLPGGGGTPKIFETWVAPLIRLLVFSHVPIRHFIGRTWWGIWLFASTLRLSRVEWSSLWTNQRELSQTSRTPRLLEGTLDAEPAIGARVKARGSLEGTLEFGVPPPLHSSLGLHEGRSMKFSLPQSFLS